MIHPLPESLSRSSRWSRRAVAPGENLVPRPGGPDLLVPPQPANELLLVAYAGSPRALDAALRLRYEVFNLELKEGLLASHVTGRDRDPFDEQMAHLLLVDRATGEVVGTYRVQDAAMASAGAGWYCAQEFDLGPLADVLPDAVECGRASIAREARSFAALQLLWAGLRHFVRHRGRRWLFGCCSLTTLDPDDGWRALRQLRAGGALAEDRALARACPGCSCGEASRELDPALEGAVRVPRLFTAYLRIGAHVVSEPAIDREFGTVDFLILQDEPRMPPLQLAPPPLDAPAVAAPAGAAEVIAISAP